MDEVKVFKSSCGEFFKDEETCREFEEIKTKGMQELKTKMIFENKISEKTRSLLKSIELYDLPQVLSDISIIKQRNLLGWKLVSTSTAVVDTSNQFSNLYFFWERQSE